MKRSTYSLFFLTLLIGLIIAACKKDKEEVIIESEQIPMHVFITNSPESNVHITAIEVRVGNENWSESVMAIGQAIFSSETQD